MSDDIDPKERERRIRVLDALAQKTPENGCTQEEAEVAAESMIRLMGEWAIQDHELSGSTERPKKMIRQRLDKNKVKYANGWRVRLSGTIANNCGVYDTYQSKVDIIEFWGQEHLVAAAAMIAETLVWRVEVMSREHAKRERTGTKGRRDFAEGCALGLIERILESANLAHDPRLPAIMKQSLDESETWARSVAEIGNPNSRIGSKRSEYTGSFLDGYEASESVDLREHQRTKRVT